MWEDPIVEEIRKIREAHAAEYNYDSRAIFRALKEAEIASGHKVVRLPPRRIKVEKTEEEQT